MALLLGVLLALGAGCAVRGWRLEPVPLAHDPVFDFDRHYTKNGCSVSVRKDRTGVVLFAEDRVNNDWYTTTIYLREGQSPEIGNRVTVHPPSLQPRPDLEIPRNVFAANCLEDVKRLPAEVCRLFFGYEGVK